MQFALCNLRCTGNAFFWYIQHFLRKYSRKNNWQLFSAWHAERCMQRSCVICPQADVPCTVGALFVAKPRCRPRAGSGTRSTRSTRGGGAAVQLTIDSSYLAFARTITRRARVRQLTVDNWQLTVDREDISTTITYAKRSFEPSGEIRTLSNNFCARTTPRAQRNEWKQ